jgi:lysozyme
MNWPSRALLLAAAAVWWWKQQQAADQADDTDTETSWTDDVTATALATINRIVGTPAAQMYVSQAGVDHLAQFEGLSLTRYRLGDGGYTIGRGRYYPDGGPVPPERISLETADAWFAQDIDDRGVRWVRAYVTAPLMQAQFDALVSMAYNLRPASFKQIAAAVNAGEDPEAAALRFVRAGTHLEKGLRRRRTLELALYRSEGIA